MANVYHATPYDISATGFYFSYYEEYAEKAASHKNEYGDPVEEYEIQFIEGNNGTLFNVLSINQASLAQWFEDFEGMDGEDAATMIYTAQYLGYSSLDDLLRKLDDIVLFQGTALEYAEQYIDEICMLDGLPEDLGHYFDIEAFARDIMLGGGITEAEIDGVQYLVWE